MRASFVGLSQGDSVDEPFDPWSLRPRETSRRGRRCRGSPRRSPTRRRHELKTPREHLEGAAVTLVRVLRLEHVEAQLALTPRARHCNRLSTVAPVDSPAPTGPRLPAREDGPTAPEDRGGRGEELGLRAPNTDAANESFAWLSRRSRRAVASDAVRVQLCRRHVQRGRSRRCSTRPVARTTKELAKEIRAAVKSSAGRAHRRGAPNRRGAAARAIQRRLGRSSSSTSSARPGERRRPPCSRASRNG